MDHKIEYPWCLSGVKSECEDPLGSCDTKESNTVIHSDMGNKMKIKEEPLVLPQTVSWSGIESENGFLYSECRTKVEIKEEPWWLERSSTDVDNKKTALDGTEEILGVVSSPEETSRLYGELMYGNNASPSCIITSATGGTNSDTKVGNTDLVCEGISMYENNQTQPHTEVRKTKDTAALDVKNSSSVLGNKSKCEICEKSFKHSSALKSHSRTHIGEKLHKCDICEKSFVSSYNLNVHKLIHKGIKPHKCEVCEKTFTHISGLRRHKLSHEGKRQYQCETCEKNFIYLSSLRYHALIHHEGNKRQKCEICEKTFVHLSALKYHKLIHEHKRHHYQCETCEKSFMAPSHLKQHQQVHKREKSKQKSSLLNCYNVIYPGVKLENTQVSSQENDRQCKPQIC